MVDDSCLLAAPLAPPFFFHFKPTSQTGLGLASQLAPHGGQPVEIRVPFLRWSHAVKSPVPKSPQKPTELHVVCN